MPIDPTEPAVIDATDRRAFLTRAAAGGALAATVATAGVAGLGPAGPAAAQGSTELPPTITEAYAARLAPLELAASVAYEAALSGGAVPEDLTSTLRRFQRNHQQAAAWLADHMADGTPDPRADVGVAEGFSAPAGADGNAVLSLLATLEEGLAATHLAAIETFDDTSTAKTVSQILAVQQQQAVVLGRAAGASIESLTPATASIDGTLETGAPAPTTAAEPDGSEADGSDAEGSDAEGSDDSGPDDGSDDDNGN